MDVGLTKFHSKAVFSPKMPIARLVFANKDRSIVILFVERVRIAKCSIISASKSNYFATDFATHTQPAFTKSRSRSSRHLLTSNAHLKFPPHEANNNLIFKRGICRISAINSRFQGLNNRAASGLPRNHSSVNEIFYGEK